MPMNFLHVLLPLVYKQQLRWNVLSAVWGIIHTSLVRVLLHGQIPKRNLIVRT